MNDAFEVVLRDLGYVEAPRWNRGELWFSDFTSRRVMSVSPSGQMTSRQFVAGQPSGLGFEPSGSCVVVSVHDGLLLRLGDDVQVVADIGRHYHGALNDMAIDRRGRAFVTAFPERPVGARRSDGFPDPAAPIILVDLATGESRVVADDLALPNGIGVSPDESTLVVSESLGGSLTAFDILPDGSLEGRRTFADLGDAAADGLCVNLDGQIWYADLYGEQFVLVEDGGRVVDRVPAPGRWAVACALGGPDLRTLYCLSVETTLAEYLDGGGRGVIQAVQVDVPGIPA